MKRNVHLPLTETVFYILLSLQEPTHGYHIMQQVEQLSGGEVKMAPGTLYGALENLLRVRFIRPVRTNGGRRKVYEMTELGHRVLALDCKRMQHLTKLYGEIAAPNAPAGEA